MCVVLATDAASISPPGRCRGCREGRPRVCSGAGVFRCVLCTGQVPERPGGAAARLERACRRLVPPLRLQSLPLPGHFSITADSLAAKLAAVVAERAGRSAVPSRPPLLPSPAPTLARRGPTVGRGRGRGSHGRGLRGWRR